MEAVVEEGATTALMQPSTMTEALAVITELSGVITGLARLQAEYTKLQNRIDAMYVDKLDGRIDTVFFDRKAADWRTEQERLLRTIEDHHAANRTYLDDGVRLLELAQRGYSLFKKQEPREKRRLLNFLLSNCTWKDGTS
jgi:site-specific DNA recombinase